MQNRRPNNINSKPDRKVAKPQNKILFYLGFSRKSQVYRTSFLPGHFSVRCGHNVKSRFLWPIKNSVEWDPTGIKVLNEPGTLRSPRTFIIINIRDPVVIYRTYWNHAAKQTHLQKFNKCSTILVWLLHLKWDVIRPGHSNEYAVVNAFKKTFIIWARIGLQNIRNNNQEKISLATTSTYNVSST